MIQSMTGFGAAAVDDDGAAVRVEIRAVNHRFLQVKVRLPMDYGDLEPEIDAAVRGVIERGSVTITVSLQPRTEASAVRLDLEVARQYQKSLAKLARELSIDGDIPLASLIALPGVIAAPEDGEKHERDERLVMKCVKDALATLGEMRSAEGRSLARDLDKNSRSIAKAVAKIEKRMPVAVKEHHKALARRVSELLEGRTAVQPGDLAREVALIADRMDVSEELTRLKSHLDQWATLLGSAKPVGRQLDFLVQELLREANTIGAKCNDAEVAHAVVELKTWIERLREQVQNVE